MKTGPDIVVTSSLLFFVALGLLWLMVGEKPGQHYKIGQNVLRKFLRFHRWLGDILHAWDVALTTYYILREEPLKKAYNEERFPAVKTEAPQKKRKIACS